jgi:hypothetical protein
MNDNRLKVGRVLRASSRGFTVGCELQQSDIPRFGSLVRADGITPGSTIYGLVYNISLEDDLFVRHFIGSDTAEEVIQDQRSNRQVPVEVSILSVGCDEGGTIRQCLPAHPPVTLDWLYQCTDEDVRAFTARLDYFRLVLDAREAPVDELLAASLRAGAAARPEGERETFLVQAGRELTRLLSGDPVRLEGLLRRLSAR